jgi:ribosome-binding protein aMBF1 (putative translation factor)
MSKVKTPKREFAPSVPFLVEEHLKDPEVREAYDALDKEFALVRQLIDLRQQHGLSQRQLAQRAGMQQPVIARLEGGRPASLGTLRRVAEALGAQLEVRLVPQTSAEKSAQAPRARQDAGGKRSSVKRALGRAS